MPSRVLEKGPRLFLCYHHQRAGGSLVAPVKAPRLFLAGKVRDSRLDSSWIHRRGLGWLTGAGIASSGRALPPSFTCRARPPSEEEVTTDDVKASLGEIKRRARNNRVIAG